MRGHIKKIKVKNKFKYIVRYDVYKNGKRTRPQRTFQSAREADAFLNSVLTDIDKSNYTDPTKLTVREYLDAWIEEYQVAENTYKGYKRNIKIANEHIGDIGLQALIPGNVRKMYNNLELSGTTKLYIHRTLHRAFKLAVMDNLVQKNIMDLVEPPTKDKFVPKFLKIEEVENLLELSKDTRLFFPIMFAACRGLRRSEVLSLKWNDLNFKNKCFDINESKTESGVRTVPLSDKMIENLKKYRVLNIQNLVCCNLNGQPMTGNALSKAFNLFLKNNNLPEMRFHDLRHTAASIMYKEKIDIAYISKILGHASVSITQDIYLHLFKEEEIKQLHKLDSVLKF